MDELDLVLSNEELQAAIDSTQRAVKSTAESYREYPILFGHLKALLALQLIRAEGPGSKIKC